MKAYVGQTRAAGLVAELERLGIGECVARGEMPPRRTSWFYDNGAFGDWRAGRPFDFLQFWRDMRSIRLWQDEVGISSASKFIRNGERLTAPDFVVLPDLVAGGLASLDFSAEYYDEARDSGAPLYLAVQDGMTVEAVERFAEEFRIDGLFVGGSLAWKLETAAAWVELARRRGLKVHVGRVGTVERVQRMKALGVDSIDSSLPLWSAEKMAGFVGALGLEAELVS